MTEASVLRRLAPEDAVGASITDGGSSVWGIGLNYESRGLSTGRTPPADTYDTPDDLELTTRVNAVVRQRDRTSGMLLSVPEVVALISAHAVLRPGDIVLTGSPAGTGDEDDVYLRAGDVVEVALADLPPLTSTIIGSSERYDGDTEVGNGRRLASQNQGSTK